MKQKNIEIQFLRVISIALVFVQHMGIALFPKDLVKFRPLLDFTSPLIGVDIFFVISGYLMGHAFLGRAQNITDLDQKLDVGFAFLKRRFLRLFPAAILWATIPLIISIISRKEEFWLTPADMFGKWSAAVFSVRNFENIINISGYGYYWSLSIENQFYLFLPLLWFCMSPRWFWALVVALIVVLTIYLPGGEGWYFMHFTGLVWGLLLYKIRTTESVERRLATLRLPSINVRIAAFFVALAAMSGLPIALGYGSMFSPLSFTVVSAAATIMVGLASLDRGFLPIPKFLRSTAYWGGELSYSLYLCHVPVWYATRDIAQRFGFQTASWKTLVPIELVLTILIAYLSYRFVELPFYRGKSEGPQVIEKNNVAIAREV